MEYFISHPVLPIIGGTVVIYGIMNLTLRILDRF